MSYLLPVVCDIFLHKIGDGFPIDLDSAPGAYLLTVPAPVAVLTEKRRRNAEVDTLRRAIIDAERAFGIEAFLLIYLEVEAPQVNHLQCPIEVLPAAWPVGAARPRVKPVVLTSRGQGGDKVVFTGRYPAAALGRTFLKD